jgi:hypothetical protein
VPAWTHGKLATGDQTIALAHETAWARSPDQTPWGVHQTDPAPWNRLFGPVHERGGVCGVIMQDGNVLAGFGDTGRADLTFSVAKTYLALLAGVAHEQGLLPDVHEAVGVRLSGIGFDDDHNSAVTWHHLLQQTSEWTGECFGIPDQVDHYRQLEFAPPTGGTKGDRRPLHQPGSYWEYNDVRINQLSLALLHLFRRPLPDVFAEFIAGPAGASTDWAWRGYDNAWVEIDGKKMQSVPGGTHWGGGISISASDQAKIGQILLGPGGCKWPANTSRRVDRYDARTLPDCLVLWLPGLAQRCTSGYFRRCRRPATLRWAPAATTPSFNPQPKLCVVVRWLDDATMPTASLHTCWMPLTKPDQDKSGGADTGTPSAPSGIRPQPPLQRVKPVSSVARNHVHAGANQPGRACTARTCRTCHRDGLRLGRRNSCSVMTGQCRIML